MASKRVIVSEIAEETIGRYFEIENIGIVEFSMEENQSEILIKNIYFKNL